VQNRSGATGNTGAEAVAKAEPDGYTLLVAPPPPLAVNQHLFNKLRFDPAAFVPITVIATAPNVLVARPGLPAGSVPELIALAKSQPGKLTYGSTGRGSTMHLSAEMLKCCGGSTEDAASHNFEVVFRHRRQPERRGRRRKTAKLNATPVLNAPSDAAAFIAAESERWRKVIVAAHIKPE